MGQQRITYLKSSRFVVVFCLTAVSLAGCTEPDIQDLNQFVAATKAASPGKELEPLPEVEPYEPFTYTAQGLKEPFAISAYVKDAQAAAEAAAEAPKFVDNGVRPDENRPQEELEKYAMGSLQMVGTFQDFNTEALWALIKAPGGIIHRVRKGNYMGQNYGEIKVITEQRVDLVEIISDDVMGWVERDGFLSLAE